MFYRNDEEGMERDRKHRHRLASSPIFSPSPLSNMFQIHQRDGRQYGGFGSGFGGLGGFGGGGYGGFGGGGYGGFGGGLFGGLFGGGGGGDYYDDDYYDEEYDRHPRRYNKQKGGKYNDKYNDDDTEDDDSYRPKKSYKKEKNYEKEDDSYKSNEYKSDRDGYKPYDKQDYKPYQAPSYRPEYKRNDYKQREENYRNLASTIDKNQINAKPPAIASKIEQVVGAAAGKQQHQQAEAVHAGTGAATAAKIKPQ